MEPSGLLLFVLMFVSILCFLGALWFISRTRAWFRGESFWPYRPVMSRPVVQHESEPRTPRTETPMLRSAQQEAVFSDIRTVNVQTELAAFDPPNEDEMRRMGQAIAHNVRGATKQAAIETAFGVKKGGSAGWRRASLLFDLATAPPPDPHPHLTAQQKQRWEPEPATRKP